MRKSICTKDKKVSHRTALNTNNELYESLLNILISTGDELLCKVIGLQPCHSTIINTIQN